MHRSQHFPFWRCFDFSFFCRKPIPDLLRITRITPHPRSLQPSQQTGFLTGWVTQWNSPERTGRDWQKDEDWKIHVMESISKSSFLLVLRCFHDAPGVLNNNISTPWRIYWYYILVTSKAAAPWQQQWGAGWRSSNWVNWKRSTKPFRTEKPRSASKKWQIRCIYQLKELKRGISCYL